MQDLSAFSARPRLAALLDHFAKVKDARQACKVMYPLREVLFLVVCGTIASGDDYDDIVDWGQAHLPFPSSPPSPSSRAASNADDGAPLASQSPTPGEKSCSVIFDNQQGGPTRYIAESHCVVRSWKNFSLRRRAGRS
jgi:hypothetical protein